MNMKKVLSNSIRYSIIDIRTEEIIDKNLIDLKTDAKNEKCLNCKELCKQSFKVKIRVCPNYNPKKE